MQAESNSPHADPSELSADQVLRALDGVLGSERFSRSPRISRFLDYVVGEELSGRGSRINGTRIAIEVFDRDQTFDSRTDPVVRVEAGRLRQALEHYYLTDGRDDAIRIEVPKGGYRPRFTASEPPSEKARRGSRDLPHAGEDDSLMDWRPPHGPILAVLPLRTLGGPDDQAFFAQGLTANLITALTRFDSIQVIAQHSTARYRSDETDIRRLGSELGARFVLEGSVHREDMRIRLTAALSDTADGIQLWAETYDRRLNAAGLFELEDELTRAVAAIVGDIFGVIPRRLAREFRGKPARELTSYEAIYRFAAYLNRNRVEDFFPAKKALEETVVREPDLGQAWAGLSMLCSEDYLRGLTPERGPPRRALELANRAASLTPDSAMVHIARAFAAFTMRQPDTVASEATHAISLNPNAVGSVGFAAFLIGFSGDLDRGIAILEELHQLNPFYPSWLLGLSFLKRYMDGDYAAALRVVERFTLDESPGKSLYLAAVFGQLGRKKEAKAEIDFLVNLEPDFGRDPENYLYRNYLFEEQVDRLMDGLRKAELI